jgi:ADP-heptose:LPS heptosyltransferase
MNPAPLSSKTQRAPVVVRFAAFGDVVMLTALIGALHQRYGEPVDVLGSGPWTPALLRNDPAVADITLVSSRKTPYWLCPSQWRAVRWLAARRDVPVYLCDPEPQALALLLRAGIPRSHILRAWDTWPGNEAHWVDWWNEVARQTPEAFAESAPVAAMRSAPRLFVTDAERATCDAWLHEIGIAAQPLVLLQPGNKRTLKHGKSVHTDNKYWAPERWAQLVHAITAALPDAKVLLCGADAERPPLEAIKAACNSAAVVNLAGALPINRLLPLMQRAHSMVSIDTGPAHAAAALGCPLVVLFGAMGSTRWRPRSTGSPVVALESNRGAGATVMNIAAEQVITAWRSLPAKR